MTDTASRFRERVDTSGGVDACWPWTGRTITKKDGPRGAFDYGGTWCYAHRYAFFLANGHWPTPQANHSCDNPPCCNPLHLYEGTQQQNVADREARGRRNVRGEQHPRALFTAEQVKEIRRRAATEPRGAQSRMAREFGCSVSTINKITRGHNYP